MSKTDEKITNSKEEPADNQVENMPEQSLMGHLIELRDRLLHIVLSVLILFIALFAFSEEIFSFAAQPLLDLMPEGTTMIATGVTSPFLVPFKLVLLLSVLLAIPYILHQIWGFIAPGLYSHEKNLVVPLLVSSVFLFYCGVAFAYYVIFPILFGFFIGISPAGVLVMTDIGQYLDFIMAIFFAFGIAFEVPVATFLLIASGVTTVEKLAEKRAYIIIGAFVVGMLLTPPDIISQSLLAVPMWILFELGLVMSRLFIKKKDDATENTEYEIFDEETESTLGSEMVSDDEKMEALFDKMEREESDNNAKPD